MSGFLNTGMSLSWSKYHCFSLFFFKINMFFVIRTVVSFKLGSKSTFHFGQLKLLNMFFNVRPVLSFKLGSKSTFHFGQLKLHSIVQPSKWVLS